MYWPSSGAVALIRLGDAEKEALARKAGADAVLGSIARGELDVRIGAGFALERAGDAHRALEGRATTGKVLLIPGDSLRVELR